MIRRDILENPEVFYTFDYFNDYKDTVYWIRGLNDANYDSIVEKLENDYEIWRKKWIENWNKVF